MIVNVICRNPQEDRVIPRFGRYLRDVLGWPLTTKPDPAADAYYLSGYFDEGLLRPWPVGKPVGAYLTHKEVEPPGNEKARLFDRMAAKLDLRIATARIYAEMLADYGPTAQVCPPVERDHFTIPAHRCNQHNKTVGFSGYVYSNHRKGEGIARQLVRSKVWAGCQWKASGRGWPCETRNYSWAEMPKFYQSLDVLVVTATVEGVPMPPLEALACGVSVVIPRGVGLLDELPDMVGIHRYEAGNTKSAEDALAAALDLRKTADNDALRAVTEPYSVLGWCEQHRQAFEELCCNN
jgi:glycosyltransferase involved in cell wall biosynthesis